MNNLPSAQITRWKITRDGQLIVYVSCPYCAEMHRHRAPEPAGDNGVRASHCQSGGYQIARETRIRPESKSLVLYRFFDGSSRLLYVGITNRPERRVKEHRAAKPWWDEATNITMQRFVTYEELARAEVSAIQTEKPKYNVAHSIIPEPETLHVPNRAKSIAADANRFGTEPPRELPDPNHRLKYCDGFRCPHCGGAVFQLGGLNGQPPEHDEPAQCPDCNASWEAATWRTMNGMLS